VIAVAGLVISKQQQVKASRRSNKALDRQRKLEQAQLERDRMLARRKARAERAQRYAAAVAAEGGQGSSALAGAGSVLTEQAGIDSSLLTATKGADAIRGDQRAANKALESAATWQQIGSVGSSVANSVGRDGQTGLVSYFGTTLNTGGPTGANTQNRRS